VSALMLAPAQAFMLAQDCPISGGDRPSASIADERSSAWVAGTRGFEILKKRMFWSDTTPATGG